VKNVATKVLILFLGSSMALMAQSESNFRFGIHGTPNIGYITTDDPNYQTSANLKFNFGLIGEFYFAEHYALATGITVANRGAEMSYSNPEAQETTLRSVPGVKYKATYLQIPIRLKMTTREFGYFTGFAEFGGSADFNIDEKVQFPDNFPEARLDDDYVNLFNAMFQLGAGVEYNLGGNTSLLAGIYYNRSLIDNIEDDLDNFSEFTDSQYEYRFDYVSLRLGVLF